MNQAQAFAALRSVWLLLKHTPFGDQLRPIFQMCTPTYVPDGKTGDCGDVLFADESAYFVTRDLTPGEDVVLTMHNVKAQNMTTIEEVVDWLTMPDIPQLVIEE